MHMLLRIVSFLIFVVCLVSSTAILLNTVDVSSGVVTIFSIGIILIIS